MKLRICFHFVTVTVSQNWKGTECQFQWTSCNFLRPERIVREAFPLFDQASASLSEAPPSYDESCNTWSGRRWNSSWTFPFFYFQFVNEESAFWIETDVNWRWTSTFTSSAEVHVSVSDCQHFYLHMYCNRCVLGFFSRHPWCQTVHLIMYLIVVFLNQDPFYLAFLLFYYFPFVL